MSPEKEQKAEEIYKSSKNFVITLQILVSDIKFAEGQLHQNQSNKQFWRRTIIRCVCALGEATLNSLKGMSPMSAEFFEVALTEKELEIINERQTVGESGKTKPFFPPINENIKATFLIFTKIHSAQIEIKYDNSFKDFCDTFKLRNKLMHPRKHHDLEIKDEDYRASIRGWNWFSNTINVILQECKKELPFS